ncbi:MAG: GNAT family N-acetyltransferase [Proteobacteria bacterium]|nr:GNAT family N-acetyltransferase [Pseudomonadota bacterium]MBU1639597.1 GNAT family N-acetyltransferase [Pseudomonadota bacterium]
MTTAHIRQARFTDIDELVDLLRLLFTIEADFEFDAPRQRRGLAMMLALQGAVILIAETENRVIGMCTGQLTISTAEGGLALLVEDVAVVEAWQGQGVGRKLLKALEKWARTRNVERIQLLADRNNQTALEFYNKLGWQSTELICLRKRLHGKTI